MTELGTDTAWTFEPHPLDCGRKVLREAGWDGERPVLVLCPINPFWWPVRASVGKWLAHAVTGAYKDSHYRTIYFHNAGPTVDAAYQRYLTALAKAADTVRKERGLFLVLVAMERLDRRACDWVSNYLGGVPVFTSEQYDMYQLVSILRACHLMVSSRYHGIVTCMPGLIPSAGVTMDERIRNLMRERGHNDLLLEVDDPDLEIKLVPVIGKLLDDRERICDGIVRTVVRNLKTMARMGAYLEGNVAARYPEFPVRTGVHPWEDYLPPLSPTLRKLVEAAADG
jgi:hypothetical protein